ncbi:hypothetical protein CDAR_566331 [Caerostris darwini]|uniref:Uncharacterized protein n=1 Tax=Caerostris darwini TaxID=1538125 RepID=A0AAV4UDQ9_9ARAC|nr:hypothetical protein CDAR_566331 [Caerostris darwini]
MFIHQECKFTLSAILSLPNRLIQNKISSYVILQNSTPRKISRQNYNKYSRIPLFPFKIVRGTRQKVRTSFQIARPKCIIRESIVCDDNPTLSLGNRTTSFWFRRGHSGSERENTGSGFQMRVLHLPPFNRGFPTERITRFQLCVRAC